MFYECDVVSRMNNLNTIPYKSKLTLILYSAIVATCVPLIRCYNNKKLIYVEKVSSVLVLFSVICKLLVGFVFFSLFIIF